MKKHQIITRLFLSLSYLFFALTTLSAQLEWGTHFMDNSLSQSNMTNPALFSDFNVSITMPSVYAGISNSSFPYHKVITVDENVLRLDMDEVLHRVGPKGLKLQTNLSIESFGLNIQNERFLFNLHHGVRVFSQTHLPLETLQMAWGGNEQFIDETINIGIKENILAYHEIGFAFGFKIKHQLTIGARVKYLQGLATIQTRQSKATLYTNPEFYQLTSETDYLLQTGGLPAEKLEDIDLFDLENFKKTIFDSNSGFAFDLGMTYRFNKKLTLEASINNIGFINWKENAYDHISQGGYEFDGFDLQPLVEGGEISTDEIIDSITNIFQFENRATTFKTSTPANGYLSIRYELAQRLYLNSFLFMEKNNAFSNFAAGINLKKDFGTWWTFGVQYAYHDQSTHNIGLMTSLRLGPFQFYATTDNIAPIFDPLKAQKINFRTGLNLVFGNKLKKRRKRQEEFLIVKAKQDSLNATLVILDSLSIEPLPNDLLEVDENLILEKAISVQKEQAAAQQKLKDAAAEQEQIEVAEQRRLETAKALSAQKEQAAAQQKLKDNAEQQRKENGKDLLAQKEKQAAEQKLIDATELQRKENEKKLLVEKEKLAAQQKIRTAEIQQIKAAAVEKQQAQKKKLRSTANFGTYGIIKKTSLRAEASSSSKVLKRLNLKVKVIVLEKTSKYWWMVDQNGRIGYVKAATLKK
jgi:hypothetical protein